MKRLLVPLLLLVSAFGQNNARMLTGVNPVTTTPYIFVAADATRLVDFNSASSIAATLSSGLAVGFTSGVLFSVHNTGAGTVTITCTNCLFFSSGVGTSTIQFTQGQGGDIYSSGLNYYVQGGSGSGGGGGGCTGTCVNSVFGRGGPTINPLGTDYGSLTTPWQQVGNITSFFQSNTGGNVKIGNSSNFLELFNTSGGSSFEIADQFNDTIGASIATGGSTMSMAANISTSALNLVGITANPSAALTVIGTGGSATLSVTPDP